MEVKLIVQNGKQAGRAIPVSAAKFLIGRAEDCQLRVQSNLISRKHCMILVEEGSASVEDCGSTNGTFLNDERITGRHELHSGDRLRVGMLGLEVQLAVSVEGKRKPKVHSVQEAAARTAASTPAAQEELDISGWLGTTAGQTGLRPARSRRWPTRQSPTRAWSIRPPCPPSPQARRREAPPEKKQQKTHGPAKGVGKFHAPAKPMAESSGAAADDALRQFFHRKK